MGHWNAVKRNVCVWNYWLGNCFLQKDNKIEKLDEKAAMYLCM